MRVFVVAGSPSAKRPVRLKPEAGDAVIAADLGAQHALRWGWRVDMLVGDFDSLSQAVQAEVAGSGAAILRVPAAKDETDTELAVREALRLAPDQIVLCAALGGRTDHWLANVLLLAHASVRDVDVCIVDGAETVRLLRAEDAVARLEIAGAARDRVSLLPLGDAAEGITTHDLLYPLRGETLELGQARGVSNAMTGSRAQVSLLRGRLLVIHEGMESQ